MRMFISYLSAKMFCSTYLFYQFSFRCHSYTLEVSTLTEKKLVRGTLLKKYWKMKKYCKSQGNLTEKVGTMNLQPEDQDDHYPSLYFHTL